MRYTLTETYQKWGTMVFIVFPTSYNDVTCALKNSSLFERSWNQIQSFSQCFNHIFYELTSNIFSSMKLLKKLSLDTFLIHFTVVIIRSIWNNQWNYWIPDAWLICLIIYYFNNFLMKNKKQRLIIKKCISFISSWCNRSAIFSFPDHSINIRTIGTFISGGTGKPCTCSCGNTTSGVRA